MITDDVFDQLLKWVLIITLLLLVAYLVWIPISIYQWEQARQCYELVHNDIVGQFCYEVTR